MSELRLREFSAGNEPQQLPKKKIALPALTLVRINADDQTRCKIFCYPIIFVITLVFLSIASSYFLPNAIQNIEGNLWKDGNNIQICKHHLELNEFIIRCKPNNNNYSKIGSYVTDLKPLNQFLLLYLSINQSAYGGVNFDQIFSISLYTAQLSEEYILATSLLVTKKISLNGPVNQIFKNGKLFLLYMSKLSDSDQFYWQLQFANNSQLTPPNYTLQSQVVNPQFSLFTIILRVTLFALSLVAFLRFNYAIFKIPKDKVSVQQRLIQVLSVVTLTFNDQLYFVSVIYPNPFSSFLSAFFLWNFVVSLFIIWAVFLNRIIKNQPETQTYQFTPFVIICISAFQTIVLAYLVAFAIDQTADFPIYSITDIQSQYVTILKIIAFSVFSLASLYIFYLFIQTCRLRPDRIYRHNIFLAFTSIFFISTIVFFFLGGYNLFDYSGPKILFTLCFMNMYSFYLQYFYAPTSSYIEYLNGQQKQRRAKGSAYVDELIQIPESGEVDISLIDQQSHLSKEEEKGLNQRKGGRQQIEQGVSISKDCSQLVNEEMNNKSSSKQLIYERDKSHDESS